MKIFILFGVGNQKQPMIFLVIFRLGL